MAASIETHRYAVSQKEYFIASCQDCLVVLNSGHHYRNRYFAQLEADRHNASAGHCEMPCNCENVRCERCNPGAIDRDSWPPCPNGADIACDWIGGVCDPCAEYMPAQYLGERLNASVGHGSDLEEVTQSNTQ